MRVGQISRWITIPLLALGIVAAPAASQPFSCPANILQVYAPGGQIGGVDLVNGDFDNLPNDLGFNANSAGYREADNFVYVFATEDNTALSVADGDLIRVGSNGDFENLGQIADPNGALGSAPFNRGIAADFGPDGHLHVLEAGQDRVVRVDVQTQTVVSAYALNDNVLGTTDVAYNPVTGLFYGVENSTDQLYSWVPEGGGPATGTPGSVVRIGADVLPNIPTFNENFGALIADRDGRLFGIANDSGGVFEFDVTTGLGTAVGQGQGNVSGNDGAFCPLAAIALPTEFGDAPVTGTVDGINTAYGTAAQSFSAGNVLVIGAASTVEGANQPSNTADADTDDGLQTVPSALTTDTEYSITIPVLNGTGADATLCGFIDAGGANPFNGGFDASDERVCATVPTNTASQDIALVFAGLDFSAVPGTSTYLRLRLSGVQSEAEAATGTGVSIGEVEDYLVTVNASDPLAGLPPFTCTGDFYQVHGTPTSSVSLVDLAAGNFSTIANSGANVRATGLDPASLFAYSIQTQSGTTAGNVLFAIGSNGEAANLGTVSGLTARNYPSGDFGPGGLFYIRNNGNNRPLVGINVETLEVETLHTPTGLTNNPNTADFAFNPVDQSFYAVESNSLNARLLRFTLNAGTTFTVESVGETGISTRGSNGNNVFGAMYADSSGNVYGIRNSTGRLYQFSTTDGTPVIVGQAAQGSQNDGFSCSQVETVIPRDFGDAQTDGTVVAGITTNYGEASQARDPGNLFIGVQAPTAEQSNINASDNADGDANDEAVLADAFQGGVSYDATVSVRNNTGGDAFLCGFIDAGTGGDGFDGTFDAASERVCATVPSNNASQSVELNWTGLDFGTNSTTFLRLRLATVQSEAEAATGDGTSIGEVEDYAVTIVALPTVLDFGDAPTSYGSASHGIVDGLNLGAVNDAPDQDATNQPSGQAIADDLDGNDDDDAVAVAGILGLDVGDTSYNLGVQLVNQTGQTATVHAWIDFNRNGSFEANEYTFATVGASNGASTNLAWGALPAGISAGDSVARFRITTQTLSDDPLTAQDERAVGLALDGEVEDHGLTIHPDIFVFPSTTSTIETCAAPVTGTFSGPEQVNWRANSPPGTRFPRSDVSLGANLDNDGRFEFRIAPGLNSAQNVTQIRFTGADSATLEEAYENGDFVEYRIRTAASLPPGTTLSHFRAFLTGAGGSVYDFGLLISEDPNFATAVVMTPDASQPAVSQGPGNTSLANGIRLEPSTTYFIRYVPYNNTGSGIIGFDDFRLHTSICTEHADAPSTFGAAAHIQPTNAPELTLGAAKTLDVSTFNSPDADGDVDDGVTIPALTAGQSATFTAEVTGAGGFLQAWIDFDGSGTFEDGEQIATDLQDDGADGDATAADGTITFDVSVPADAVTVQTFARFRWSTIDELDATTAAPDGEVEDYAVAISPPEPSRLPPVPTETCTINWHRWQTARQPGANPAAVNPTTHGFGVIDTALGAGTWYEPLLPFQPGVGTTPADNVPNTQLGRSTFDETTENSARARTTRSGEGFYGIARFELEPNVTTIIPLNDPAFVDGHAFMAFDSAGNPLARFPSVATLNAGQSYIAANSQRASEASAVDFESAWTDNTFQVDVPADGVVIVHYVLADDALAHRHALRYCPQDVGDAPVTFGAAGHVYEPNLLLGSAKDVDVNLVGDDTGAVDDNDGNGDNDEDGVTIPVLNAGQTATITADVTGTGGFLQAWIDFDGSGTFEDGEQIATNLQDDGTGGDATAADGTLTFDVPVPASATTDQTFARFRWSSTSSLDAVALAPDGEVEDYAVTIGGAPFIPENPTGTCRANWYYWNTNIGPNADTQDAIFYGNPRNSGFDPVSTSLGNGGWYETTRTPSQTFLDQSNAFRPTETTSASFTETFLGITRYEDVAGSVKTLELSDPGRFEAHVFAIFDSAGNQIGRFPSISRVQGGQFYVYSSGITAGGEAIDVGLAWSTAANFAAEPFTFTVPADGVYFLHYIMQDDFNASSFVQDSFCGIDFSDTPATYGAADHIITAGVELGATNTVDAAAADDDSDVGDDGVTIPALTAGETATITADVTGTGGFLQAWIDFDGSGTFEDGEQIATNLQDDGTGGDATAGDGTLTFDVAVPANTVTTQTFARFRWSTTSGLNAIASAPDGEVEDYAVTAVPALATIRGSVFVDDNQNNIFDTGEQDVSNVGVAAYAAGPDAMFGTPDDVLVASGETGSPYELMVPPGIYDVRIDTTDPDLPLGTRPSITTFRTANVVAGDVLENQNFGVAREDTAVPATPAATNPFCVAPTNWRQLSYQGIDDQLQGPVTVPSSVDGLTANVQFTRPENLIWTSTQNGNTGAFDGSEHTTILPGLGRTDLVYTVDQLIGLDQEVTQTFTGRPVYEIYMHFNSVDQVQFAFQLADNPGIGWELVSGNDDLANVAAAPDFTLVDILEGDQDMSVSDEDAGGDAGRSADGTVRFYSLTEEPIDQLVWRFVQDTFSRSLFERFQWGTEVCIPLDVSDAPLTGTSFGAATHGVIADIRLGNVIGADVAAFDSPDASADDDDGVVIPTLMPGAFVQIPVTAFGANGFLQAWVDFDGNGTFEDDEQIASDVQETVGNGAISLPVTPPTDAVLGTTFARFRWSTQSGLDATENAPDGEVEDYQVTIVSGGIPLNGNVFFDNGAGSGANAHNGLIEGTEQGAAAVELVAFDVATGNIVATGISTADGSFSLNLPPEQDGRETRIEIVPPADTFIISGNPASAPATFDPANGTFTLTPALGATQTGLDFGLASAPRLTLDQELSIQSGGVAVFSHRFITGAPVDANFAITNEESTTQANFSTTLFLDADCSGTLDAGETLLTGAQSVGADQELCLLVRVANVSGSAQTEAHQFELSATGTYAGTAIPFGLTNLDRVTIGAQAALQLTKTVCNLTSSTCDVATGAGFDRSNAGAPGDTLIYRLAFENNGDDVIDDVTVNDDTPAFSSLTTGAPSVVANPQGLTCTLTEPLSPIAGFEGGLEWTCPGQMQPGAQGVVTFEVRIAD